MTKSISAFCFLFVIALPMSTASAVSLLWSDWYDDPTISPSVENASKVAALGNGNFISVGSINANGTETAIVRGFVQNGPLVTWTHAVGLLPSFSGSNASQLAVSPNGVVMAGGEAWTSNGNHRVYIQKIDPSTGASLFSIPRFFLGRAFSHQKLVKLVADPWGDFYALVRGTTSAGSTDVFVTKFAATGARYWTYRHKGLLPHITDHSLVDDEAVDLLPSTGGTVMVIGDSRFYDPNVSVQFGRPWAILLNAFSASSLGERLGEFNLGLDVGVVTKAAELASGEFILVGWQRVNNNADLWIKKLRLDFSQAWHSDYDNFLNHDVPADLVISPTSGDPLVLITSSLGLTAEAMLLGFSSSAGILNVQDTFWSLSPGSWNWATQMQVTSMGHLMISANSYQLDPTTYAITDVQWGLLKTTALGNILNGYPVRISNPSGPSPQNQMSDFALDPTGTLAIGQSVNFDADFAAHFWSP